MRKKILTLVGISLLALQIYGQNAERSPLNPDLKKYVKNHPVDELSNEGYKLNYIPAPLNITPSYKAQTIQSGLKSALVISLPATYDLRELNYVTAVKNQGSGSAGGNCWAFATLGAIESSWVKKGFGTFDLSEQNMATCHGYAWGFGDGGNEFLALAYLSSFKGPVRESSDPYTLTGTHSCKTVTPVAYVPESRMVFTNALLLKQIIMDYGGVYTPIHWDDASYNSSNFTLIYKGKEAPNHAVLIVGWDDNRTYAGGTGVWICKNSWGTSWGESGYFYVPFKDTRIANPIVYYPYRWNKWDVNTVYTYDELGVVSTFGYGGPTGYSLVKFTAPKAQYIKKIGTFITATGSLIDIDIYKDKNGDTLKNLLASVKNQQCRSAGFYTFDIPVQVNGDFYVQVKYFCPEIRYPLPIEMKIEVDGRSYSDPFIEPSGKQWVSKDRKEWLALGSDIAGYEADLCIKAYAVDNLGPKANFTTDKYEVCAGNSITFTDKSVGNITSYQWDFGTEAQPATASGSGSYSVSFASGAQTGLHLAKLIVTGPDGSDTITKEYRVVNGLNTSLVSSLENVKIHDTTQLMAVGDGSSFKWTPSTYLSSDTGRVVAFHADVPAKYKVTVSSLQGTCTGSVSIDLEVLKPPVNDDMCNAIELYLGKNGPFSNVNATVEHNEPMPADTCCNCPMTWCNEGGLQNSVWFKFAGTESENTSIDTKGFDSEIAVYSSNSCDSIKIADLVAANDDFHPQSELWAAEVDMVPVTAGKNYWLQVDGSAGGDTCSSFYIYLYDGPVGIDQVNSKNDFKISPNPNLGFFNITYSSDKYENITVQAYDLTGRIAVSKSLRKNKGELNFSMDLTGQPAGFYFIRLIEEKGMITEKVIIK